MGLTKDNPRPVQTITTGIHLVEISKIGWGLDTSGPEKKVLSTTLGNAFDVTFSNTQLGTHFTNRYWLGGEKQKFFEQMLSHISVNPKEKIVGKNILKKRIWIAVCELVETKGDTIETDQLGNEIKNHFIFKTYPFIEGGQRPFIEGDPEQNNGIPRYEFRRYKDVSNKMETHVLKPQKEHVEPVEEKKATAVQPNTDFATQPKQEVKKEEVVDDEPNFGDDLPPAMVKKEEVVDLITSSTNVQDVFEEEPNF